MKCLDVITGTGWLMEDITEDQETEWLGVSWIVPVYS